MSLAFVVALFGFAVGAATNIATGLIPDDWAWAHDPVLMWSLTATLIVAASLLAALLHSVGSKHEDTDEPKTGQQVPQAGDYTVVTQGDNGVVANRTSGLVIGQVGTINFPHSDPNADPSKYPIETRSVSNLPRHNTSLVGRRQELDEIAHLLVDGAVTLRGLGGVGKSTIALHYARTNQFNGTYRITWWIPAEDDMRISENLTDLALELGIPSGQDQSKIVAAVLSELNRTSDWLLVYDNAANPDTLRRWLPSGDGKILITSRNRGWGRLSKQFELKTFSHSDAVDFMNTNTTNDEPESTSILVDELGCLPLALAQAAAYFDTHSSMSIKSYLNAIRDRERAAEVLAEGLPESEYPKSVATTWLLHFDDLRDHYPAALDLLRICSFLASEEIPVSDLLSKPDQLPEKLSQAAHTAKGRSETIDALTRTHLATTVDSNTI